MAEFVREHGTQFGDGQRLQQRQPDTHHPAAADAHDASALRDPRVDVREQVDLARPDLLGAARDIADEVEQVGVRVRRQFGPRGLEPVGGRA